MAKSIGSVYIDVLAKIDNLEKDMERAKKSIGEAGSSMRKSGEDAKAAFASFQLFNSFQGRGMTGIVGDMTALTMAVQLVRNELRYMYDNVDKIPGINPMAVASINEFKINLLEARNVAAGWTAAALGGILEFGKAIGVGMAALVGYEGEYSAQLESMDKLREANDPTYWDKVGKARQQNAAALQEEKVAALGTADRIAELRKQSMEFEMHAKAASTDSLTRLEDKANAHKKMRDALNLEVNLEKQYQQSLAREGVEAQKGYQAQLTQLERIREIRRLIDVEMAARKATIDVNMATGGITNKEKEETIKHMERIVGWNRALREELNKTISPARAFNDAFIGTLQTADQTLTSLITGGKAKLSDFLLDLSNTVIQTAIKLAVVNPLINAMFGGGVGGALLPAVWGSGATKRAAGGPAGGMTWVGEHGPELVNLPGGSYVNSNQSSRNMAGSGETRIYNIDARGADMGAVDRIERILFQLAGPGVVEQRATSAVTNAKIRRQ